MNNPLALLPLALAAGGGTVDEFEAQQLVAAGLTLLQRCAPLVRALSGRRSAILLPTSPAYFTALAASDGRGAVLVDPRAAPLEIAAQFHDANVGAAFTITSLTSHVPANVPLVLLDDAPRAARYVGDGVARDVDLGSHHGLTIAGDPDAPGRDEEAVIFYTSAMAGEPRSAVHSHQSLIASARRTTHMVGNTAADHVLALLPFSSLAGLMMAGLAPLFVGGHVTAMSRFDALRAVDLIDEGGITEVVGDPSAFSALLAAWRAHGAERREALRLCICGGAPLDTELQRRWLEATGVELHDAATVGANELRR